MDREEFDLLGGDEKEREKERNLIRGRDLKNKLCQPKNCIRKFDFKEFFKYYKMFLRLS